MRFATRLPKRAEVFDGRVRLRRLVDGLQQVDVSAPLRGDVAPAPMRHRTCTWSDGVTALHLRGARVLQTAGPPTIGIPIDSLCAIKHLPDPKAQTGDNDGYRVCHV